MSSTIKLSVNGKRQTLLRKFVTSMTLLALGCVADSADQVTRAEPKVVPVAETSLPDLPAGHPTVGLDVRSRGSRRMSVEQIERSLEAIAQLPEGTVKLPDSLALTLGRPDYRRVTEESLEPSALFMKFMVDLGAIVCTNLSDADLNRPESERALFRYSDLDENLRYLLLRFTGIEGLAADEYVPRLRDVHERGRRGARGERGGMEAVCLALFTSPEFLVY
ncbi:MAG: hypothetical protein HY791_08885 [Deltaproteobacteria bacterium]|nr:hypothetical protein [Deltaproteobacteria bacterium]